jgi:hypothetical protein
MILPWWPGAIALIIGGALAFVGRGAASLWGVAAGLIGLGILLILAPSLVVLEIAGLIFIVIAVLCLFGGAARHLASPGLFIIGSGSLAAAGAVVAGYL